MIPMSVSLFIHQQKLDHRIPKKPTHIYTGVNVVRGDRTFMQMKSLRDHPDMSYWSTPPSHTFHWTCGSLSVGGVSQAISLRNLYFNMQGFEQS